MSPVSNNHGSATLWRHDIQNLNSNFFRNRNQPYGYLMGLNRPYARQGNVPLEVGERYALEEDGTTRLDNPDFGTAWNPSYFKGMSCCFGAGGSGKGAGLILPALTFYGGNIMTIDPKGQNAWITAERRRSMGQKVAICDPFGEVNKAYGSKIGVTEKITRYNPLARLDPDALEFPEQVGSIAEAITVAPKGGGDGGTGSFFSGASRSLSDGILAGVVMTSPPGRATFRKFLEVITLDDPSFGKWCAGIVDLFPNSYAARKLARFIDMNRTNQGIKATAMEQTDFLHSEQILRYMEPEPGEETFDFSELATGKITIFLVLPATQLVAQSPWARMMINQSLKGVLGSRATQPAPTLFLLDEAGTSLGHLAEIESAYGLARGLNVTLWSFYQDLNQLKRDYPASWETFISNSAVLQVLDAKDNTTCDYFSRYMGNKTVGTKTEGESIQPIQNLSPGAPMGNVSTSTNWGEMGRPLMTPDEIRTMPRDELLVIYPKGDNFRQFKIEYYKDARFNGLYRMDPNEQRALPPTVIQEQPDFPMEALQTKIAKQGAGPDYKRFIKPALWGLLALSFLQSCGDMMGHTRYGKTVSDWQTTLFLLVAVVVAQLVLKSKKPVQKLWYWWIDRKGFLRNSTLPW